MSANITPLSFDNSAFTVINGEPRMHDLAIGQALGFDRPRDVRKLIERHQDTLSGFGEVCAKRRKPTSAGGRPGTEYWLNRRQTLYITAKSDTPDAALITVQMVEVFDTHLSGERVTQVKAHTRRVPPMSDVVNAIGNANITPRQLLQQQLENHARAIFAVLEDSLPIGLDRLEHVWLHNKNGKLTIGSTIFPHGEWRHGDLSAVLTPEYRWAIQDGKQSAAHPAISNSKGK